MYSIILSSGASIVRVVKSEHSSESSVDVGGITMGGSIGIITSAGSIRVTVYGKSNEEYGLFVVAVITRSIVHG